MSDVDGSVRCPLNRDGQFDDRWRHRSSRIGRGGHRDEGIQDDGAIVVRGFDRRCIGRVARLRVPLPMRVNGSPRMVFSGVFVGMRVYKRSAQARSLDGHRKRYGEHSAHDALIVRDPAHDVKAAGSGTIAVVTGWQSGPSPQATSASSTRMNVEWMGSPTARSGRTTSAFTVRHARASSAIRSSRVTSPRRDETRVPEVHGLVNEANHEVVALAAGELAGRRRIRSEKLREATLRNQDG